MGTHDINQLFIETSEGHKSLVSIKGWSNLQSEDIQS